MKKNLLNLASSLLAAGLLAAGTNAFAASSHYSLADADRTPSQSQPPVDCKEKPEDARCKDKK